MLQQLPSSISQPPTPQSPCSNESDTQQRMMREGYCTPAASQQQQQQPGFVSESSNGNLRFILETSTPQQALLAALQALHRNPGSFSSCSSVSSQSLIDYFSQTP